MNKVILLDLGVNIGLFGLRELSQPKPSFLLTVVHLLLYGGLKHVLKAEAVTLVDAFGDHTLIVAAYLLDRRVCHSSDGMHGVV